MKEYFSKQWEG